MERPWLKLGRKIFEDGLPVYCDECPCEISTCQCTYHVYAMWCYGYPNPPDPDVPGKYLTVTEVKACFPARNISAFQGSTYVFVYDDDAGNGCFDLGGEQPEGWSGWCKLPDETGGLCNEPGGDAFCPLGILPILNYHTGPPGCTPCDGSPDGCTPPTGTESLPANPVTLDSCA